MSKLTNIQLENINNLIKVNKSIYPNWREGELYFNSLYELYPRIADLIRGTEYDMFYVDSNIDKFKNKFVI